MIDPPAWLAHAYGEIGVHEIEGAIHEERILAYHAHTALKASADEVPWCSSFVNWCFAQESMDHTNSAAARSWLGWGVEIDQPRYGCVAVLARGPEPQPGPSVLAASGHVGFFVGWHPGSLALLLGGNQGDSVSISAFPARRILGLRWPAAGEIRHQ